MCDEHPHRVATHRVQGETDSFGSEMHDMCDECYAIHKAQVEVLSGVCDWCKNFANRLRDYRDIDEGLAGPIHQVCDECIRQDQIRLQEELEDDDNKALNSPDVDFQLGDDGDEGDDADDPEQEP
jgi:hypothetical protein